MLYTSNSKISDKINILDNIYCNEIIIDNFSIDNYTTFSIICDNINIENTFIAEEYYISDYITYNSNNFMKKKILIILYQKNYILNIYVIINLIILLHFILMLLFLI